MLRSPALQLEENKRIRREEKIREYNLRDDPVKSEEMLGEFVNSAKVVDALKDKIEEAKLIKELAESDVVNYRLFEQAYMASVDASNFLDSYQMSKLFRGSYDMHATSVVITAGDKEMGRTTFKNVYWIIRWAEMKGHKGRVVDKHSTRVGGLKSATIEFEFEFAYGYQMGETGVHRMMGSVSGSTLQEASLAAVDVTPLFLDTVSNLALDDKDLIFSYTSSIRTEKQQEVRERRESKEMWCVGKSSGKRKRKGKVENMFGMGHKTTDGELEGACLAA